MIACMPVFLSGEKLDWEQGILWDVLCSRLRELEAVEAVEAVYLVTDSDKAATIPRSEKCRSVVARARRTGKNKQAFHDRALHALKDIAGQDDPVFFLNFKNPLITRQIIADAIHEYGQNSAQPLVSVKKPEDHPYYLKEFQKIVSAGTIHVLETNPHTINICRRLVSGGKETARSRGLKHFAVTKPFFFPWEAHVPDSTASRLFARTLESGFVRYNPLPPDEPGHGFAEVWIREGNRHARIAWPKSPLSGPMLRGLTAGSDLGSAPDVVLRQKEHGLYFEAASKAHAVLSLLAFDRDHPLPKQVRHLELRDGTSKPIDLDLNERIAGFIFYLGQSLVHKDYDFERAFDPGGVAWKDHINLEKNCKITGRQTLPDVFEIDDSFCISTLRQLKDLKNSGNGNGMHGYALAHGQSLQLQSRLDLARFQIIQKMRGTP